MKSEADGGIAVEVNLLNSVLLHFFVMQQNATEGQSDKAVSDIGMYMKYRHGTKFLHAEEFAPLEIQ